MAGIALEDIKRGLRIDNEYSDELIQTYIDSAVSALFVTVGKGLETEDYNKLKKAYVQEYVRGLFFELDTERIINTLQAQMEAMVSIYQEEETLD